MAGIAGRSGGVDRSALLTDFVIPATVDMMIAAIESDSVTMDNYDEWLSKIGASILTAAQQTVTPDMEPYVPRFDGIPMPHVLPLVHQINHDIGGDFSISIEHDEGVRTSALAYQPAGVLPVSEIELASPASVNFIAEITPPVPVTSSAFVSAVPQPQPSRARPVQDINAPTLSPSHNRRKSDRQQPVRKGTAARIAAPPEPKLRLPRGIRSVNETVRFDGIICLEDGKKVPDLAQYLQEKFNVTPEDYRKKWGLSEGYPMKSPKLILTHGHVRQYQPVTGTYVPVH